MLIIIQGFAYSETLNSKKRNHELSEAQNKIIFYDKTHAILRKQCLSAF